MKTISVIMILLFLLTGCSRLKEVKENERTFQMIYEVPGLTKKQIHDKSAEWMAITFVSSKAVIEINNPESGKIVGNGRTYFTNVVANIPCTYTISIDSKDGRFRITFDNYIAQWGIHQERRLPLVERAFVDEVNHQFLEMAENLNKYMKESKSDNW